MRRILQLILSTLILLSCTRAGDYDLVIRNGTIYDGSGATPYTGDLAVSADTIAAIGDLGDATGTIEVDAEELAVAPGFINMLSWATESLIEDGRGLSDLKQGVTLEVFGEGWSMGPLTDSMKVEMKNSQSDITYEIEWTTLAEYLEFLVDRGVSPNVASFVGATTVRIHELGYEDRSPTAEELERMQALVRSAMENGALGVGSSLIYAPAFYADSDELIALSRAASEYGGIYISHMRSEGNRLMESLDELITIAREANLPAEVYHLKMAGRENWDKFDDVVAKIDSAREAGLSITADMYTYTAGATGLDAAMPPWVQEGGFGSWRERLQDPEIRRKVQREMTTPADSWENLMLAAGTPENILLVEFRTDSLRYLTGKTLAEVAEMRGTPPAETAMDLVVEDSSRVGTVYFLMSEENVKKQIALPWMSFGSDAGAPAPEGVFLNSNPHPRAYGNFARLLGKYVREERVIPLEEAVYKLTTLPATNLKIKKRGALKVGHFADVVIFDPDSIQDHATFQDPHQLAEGVIHVWVNGRQVIEEGTHTGATPGRVVRGPGYDSDRE